MILHPKGLVSAFEFTTNGPEFLVASILELV